MTRIPRRLRATPELVLGCFLAWLLLIALSSRHVAGQTPPIALTVGWGTTLPAGVSRFTGASPGFMVDGSASVRVSPRWSVGLGGSWATFGGDVPEFGVFAPLDHDAWLEYSLLFVEARRDLGAAGRRVQPFLAARLGRASELAEYSGAEIVRRGPLAGLSLGATWALTRRLIVQPTGTAYGTALGAGELTGLGGRAAGERSVVVHLALGLSLALG